MAQGKTQNALKNTIFAVVLKLSQIAFPFVSRTIIIHTLGLAYVGVSGLFTSIFGVLSIAELGVGSALLQALYEPIKQNDKAKVKAIINFYRKAYFAVGVVITVLGFALAPFLKYIIKAGTYPEELNIYYIYFVQIISTSIGYLVYSYKSLLLEAHQRGRDANKVRIFFSFLQYGVQIPLLLITHNYYLYISIAPICGLLSIIVIAAVCDKRLPGYLPEGRLTKADKDILKEKITALFFYKIGSVIHNHVDGIVISAFLGATILGAFNNYYYIVSSVAIMILVCYTAILPSVGNGAANKTREENYNDLLDVIPLDGWLNGWCSICLACLLTPFIQLWAGSESNMGELIAILFGGYFYIWRIMDPVSIYKDALGVWYEDRWKTLITAIVNLVANIFLVQYIGVYGILLSTILASVSIGIPASVKALMNYFHKSTKEYYVSLLKITLFVLIVGVLTWNMCKWVSIDNGIVDFILEIGICLVVPNAVFLYAYRNHPKMKKVICIFTKK